MPTYYVFFDEFQDHAMEALDRAHDCMPIRSGQGLGPNYCGGCGRCLDIAFGADYILDASSAADALGHAMVLRHGWPMDCRNPYCDKTPMPILGYCSRWCQVDHRETRLLEMQNWREGMRYGQVPDGKGGLLDLSYLNDPDWESKVEIRYAKFAEVGS